MSEHVLVVEVVSKMRKYYAEILEFMDYGTVITTETNSCSNCFEKYKMVKPSFELTDAFATISRKIFSKIKTNGEKVNVLTKIHGTLLPKLISGEIRL